MSIINRAFAHLMRGHLSRVDQMSLHPLDIQHRMFQLLMANLAKTKYGQQYHIAPTTDYPEFARCVPIATYDDLLPYIERMRQKEANVLWPGAHRWYAKSSGTTSTKSKFIPVTRQCLKVCHYRGGYDLLALYFRNYPRARVFSGRGLTLGGSYKPSGPEGWVREGDLSAILLRNVPTWVDFVRTPSRAVALLADWDQKLEGIAKEALHQNVTSITGVPSWNLLMLQHMLQVSGKSNLLELWPNLEVFFHGGMNFAPYRAQFDQLIPSAQMRYMESYNASEGYFGLQNEPNRHDMLLMLDYGVFYEFIPMDSFHSANPTVLPLEGVEKGVNYALVISSTNGLWRYIIGDTITFTELKPYKFLITGRTKHFINAFGEEVIIDNADRALAQACQRTGAIVQEYTAAPRYMDLKQKGCHEWFIEFANAPEDLSEFTRCLDQALTEINSDYEAKRHNDITLRMPLVHAVPQGTFVGWMASRGKVGGQNKVPRLSNDRQYVDSLSAYLQKDHPPTA